MAKIGIKDIITTSDRASAVFDKAVSTSEQKMFDEVLLLIKNLETTPQGNIKTSIANLKRVQQIRTKLYRLANNKDYLQAVRELVGTFDTLYRQQLQFYAVKNQSTVAEQKHNLIKTIARENTIAALTGDGLAANVTTQLDKMLLRAVTSGARFADLQKELSDYLLTNEGGNGALSRYAKTYAVTALSQYAGQNNKLFTDDLDTEWYEYVGSEIETTRPFCEACLQKRYIHRSEFHDLLRGHIHIVSGDDIDVKLYDKTNLPYGMIEGTNEENLQINVGGWNCRHQLIPIAAEAVPENIRQEIEGVQRAEKKAEELRKSKEYTNVETNAKGGLKATHKGHIVHSAQKEQTYFAEHLTSTDLELACQDQLYQWGHTAILRDESQTNSRGEFLPSLDLELDGKLMDIASVTNTTGTCGSALLHKNKQLAKVAKKTDFIGEDVCLYFYNKSQFSKNNVLRDIEYFKKHIKEWNMVQQLKHIHIVVRGEEEMFEFEI